MVEIKFPRSFIDVTIDIKPDTVCGHFSVIETMTPPQGGVFVFERYVLCRAQMRYHRIMPSPETSQATERNPFVVEKRREHSREKFGDALVDAIEESASWKKWRTWTWSPRESNEPAALLASGQLPVLAGKGGEHLVFEVAKKGDPTKLRDVVVKVNVPRHSNILSLVDLQTLPPSRKERMR